MRQFHHWNRSKASSNQVTANCAFPRYGMNKIAAIPAVNALSGADHTGSLVGKETPHGGKHSKRQSKTSSLLLLTSEQVNHPASAETMVAIEKLICKLCVPNTTNYFCQRSDCNESQLSSNGLE